MAPPGSPRASPAEGVVTVSTLTRRVDDLADQLAATLHSVAERSAATVQCLQLLDVAGQGLEESAREAAARRDELLVSARRLALELRGLDLLAGHVKAVDALVRRLEAQAADVIAGAARQ